MVSDAPAVTILASAILRDEYAVARVALHVLTCKYERRVTRSFRRCSRSCRRVRCSLRHVRRSRRRTILTQ